MMEVDMMVGKAQEYRWSFTVLWFSLEIRCQVGHFLLVAQKGGYGGDYVMIRRCSIAWCVVWHGMRCTILLKALRRAFG